MKLINKSLILLVTFFSLQLIVNAQQDLNVFGMKLGEQFTVQECPIEIKEERYLGGKKYWELKYPSTPTTERCFMRPELAKIKINSKKDIPILPLPAPTGFVTVVSPENAKPALTADGEFYAFVLTDRSLDGVIFKINKNDGNEVFDALKQKYGGGAKVTPMKWQNSNGASYDYYIANWTLPKITIKFQSAGIFYRPDYFFDPITLMIAKDTDNAFASPYGMVQIGQRGKETPAPSKVPL